MKKLSKAISTNSPKESQVTPESVFWNRRQFIAGFAAAAGSALLPGQLISASERAQNPFSGDDLRAELSSEYVVTHHNNFYEFSTDKQKPSELA